MTWLSPGTGELRKGFESGLCGRGKGRRLTAPTVPPPASWTAKDAGPWQGPRGPRCATHPLNTPSGSFRTALPPSPTPHPFPVPSRRPSPGRELRCPQGTPLSWRRALSPSVGGRREVWGAGVQDPTSVAQSHARKSWDKDPRSPRGGGRRWRGRAQGPPLAAAPAAAREGRSKPLPGEQRSPLSTKPRVSLHTHLRRPSSPTGFFRDLPAQSWSEGSRQVPGTSSYPVPAAQRAGPAGVAGGSALTSRGEGHTGSFAQLGNRGPRLRRTLLLFPGSPLSRRRASGSRLPPLVPAPVPRPVLWPARGDALVGLEPKVPPPSLSHSSTSPHACTARALFISAAGLSTTTTKCAPLAPLALSFGLSWTTLHP